MREWEELLESLLQMAIKEGNPLKKGVEDGLYLELRVNQNPFVKTLNNIRKKLSLRYINEKEGLYNADDIFSITMATVIEVLFQTYIGNIRLNGINISIPQINSDELDNETDEEKEFRAEQFLKLFTNENINKYMAILYTSAIQRDFRENFKTNHLQTTTVVSQKRVDGKMKYIYEDVYNTSIDAPTVTSKDETVDTIDYLYSKNLEIKSLCEDNVQSSDINETNGIYTYILDRYWNELTNKQRNWITYAIKQDESFIKKGDNKYAPKTNRTYIEYIRDRIFKSIENDEESKVYITEKRVISWKRNNQVQDVVKKILNESNKNNQIDMLISALKKDSKSSEVIVNNLLDYDSYYPVCDLITGKISKYKFKVIYLDKVLNVLKKIK